MANKLYLVTSIMNKMPVGKHKGKTIQSVIEFNTGYADWMVANMKNVSFSQEIRDYLRNWKFLSR